MRLWRRLVAAGRHSLIMTLCPTRALTGSCRALKFLVSQTLNDYILREISILSKCFVGIREKKSDPDSDRTLVLRCRSILGRQS